MRMKKMDQATRRRLWDIIRDLRFGSLTTVDADGQLSSRPMTIEQAEFDGALWFRAPDCGSVARAIIAHSAVAVSFASADHVRFVSISGAAALVKDRNGPVGPRVPLTGSLDHAGTALIRVDVHHVEYWEPRGARMLTLFSQANAAPAQRLSRRAAWTPGAAAQGKAFTNQP